MLKDGKPLEELSRQVGQPAHILSGWRDEFFEKDSATLALGFHGEAWQTRVFPANCVNFHV